MNLYQQIIAKATGLTDIDKIRMVEDYMRQIYFHSTLNWQTQSQLNRAAKVSAIVQAFPNVGSYIRAATRGPANGREAEALKQGGQTVSSCCP